MKKMYQVTIVSLISLCILVLSFALMLVGSNVIKIFYSPKNDEEIFFEKLNNKNFGWSLQGLHPFHSVRIL